MHRRTIVFIFSLFLTLSASLGAEQLDILISDALSHNPQVQAAKHQAAGQRSQFWQAISLEPPQIGIEYMQSPTSSFPDPGKDQMERDFYVQQMVMFPAKYPLMGRMARFSSDMAEQQYQSARRKVVREVKAAYYMLYVSQKKRTLYDEMIELMGGFVQIARRQYENGMGQQADWLRAQTELAQLHNQRAAAEQEYLSGVAMLNTLAGRQQEQAVDPVAAITQIVPHMTYEEVIPILTATSPDLRAMQSNVGMQRTGQTLAVFDAVPDFMIQGRYKNLTGDPQKYWSLMIGMTVPFAPWSAGKMLGKQAESKANVRKAGAEYEAMRTMSLYQLRAALTRLDQYREQIARYDSTIIPASRRTLQSTVSSYQNGKTEFLMVLDAYGMVLMSELDHHMAEASYMTAQADLEQAVGMEIKDIRARLSK